jgi:DDE superfamily endonuclease
MPHNLMIVDYALGQPGSVHDAYAFQGTQMVQNPAGVIPLHQWIWTDSVYPCETWCAVPFMKLHGGNLT